MRVVQAQAEAARLKLMSQALQRQLPRPNHKKLQVDSEVREGMSEVEKAAAEPNKETAQAEVPVESAKAAEPDGEGEDGDEHAVLGE